MGDALWAFAGALFLLLVLGKFLQQVRPGPVGIALTELLAILTPVVALTRARRLRALRSLRLWPVAPVGPLWTFGLCLLAGGALLGAAWFYLTAAFVEPLLERLVPVPPALKEQMLRLLLPPSGLRPVWVDLFSFALMPAICEEVLFRGVLLLSFRAGLLLLGSPPRRAAVSAVLLSAALFGFFHIEPAKILPTFVLGLGFGAVALWTRSLWPSIAMHLCNNAVVILLLRAGFDAPPAPVAASRPGWAWLLCACACGGVGLALLRRGAAAPTSNDDQSFGPDGTTAERNAGNV